ncbi:BREX-2 system adenine-specific DNA-methyltransferase PglX [Synoicihabitans lomoniglobus]|uniref:site-specific DNA-methyltransferase (adenine-specific) n=1 Tax=Synoicihabitans lomoniglobus TaxID=2909285 RepID=A0AAE9ZRX3_9BACT|nr:BREX-2 system adenine-specific DNA-methyltransferase PglX [Opitutaceae bacterium LMO-M01]WED64125.1 BREX-2 system adenine-specific DNA-methyltransferase PglX [Opitutaceae bacterium LMO-M01]
MITSKPLLSALKAQVSALEDDLRTRCADDKAIDAPLRAQYDAAKARKRTAITYAAWRDEQLTQVAVAWVLACVFVRFLEDNELVEVPRLAGPGARLKRAEDEHELFFRQHPTSTEREYLETVFNDVGRLPGMVEFFDRRHNPLWLVAPSGDAAEALVTFWRRTDETTGALAFDFTDPVWNTRFLGDLYQDLSEAARKKYALLQTPDFIEEFILDRTLTPAIETFGYKEVRLIDPTCGSGHFLLGAFDRLFRLWQKHQPQENPRVLAQKALDGVYGVDLNPFAVAIARFRLLLVALKACGITRLKNAPAFSIHLAAGDSLLHGRRFDQFELQGAQQRTFDTEEMFKDELKHHYEVEDGEALHRILGQQYHAVVGNPPYITVKDRAVSALYRDRYPSCHGKYSLSVPFMERFFDLTVKGDGSPHQKTAGFVGQITGNAFMKREFGKKLIEDYLPRWDLTHVIDTAGAYIPGHGTPTVILVGKNQSPVSSTVRTVLGIAGEPVTPANPAQGLVWQAIVSQIDQPGSVSEWMSAGDSPRANFHRHPWSIGGGGAAELKELLERAKDHELGELTVSSGFGSIVGEDDAFIFPQRSQQAQRLSRKIRRMFVEGDTIRDWSINSDLECLFPYDDHINIVTDSEILNFLWSLRAVLEQRRDFSKRTYRECGRPFWEYHQIPVERNRATRRIAYAFVATHNEFVFDVGSKVFKQSAPIINLTTDASDALHRELVGLLNSSTACFWLKQVAHNKGSTVDQRGARQRTAAFEDFYEFTSTQMASFPIPAHQPTQLPTALVQTSTAMQEQAPAATLAVWSGPESGDLHARLASARETWTGQRRQLIAYQEELDWQIYHAYGLISDADNLLWPEDRLDELPPLELGERTFEIFMARQMARGTLNTTWFDRHAGAGSRAITEPPSHWPDDYTALYHRRHVAIQENPNLKLIEQPEYKRRWNTKPWDEQWTEAAREWMLARLEGYFHEGQRVCDLAGSFVPANHGFAAASGPHLVTLNQLADVVQSDATFLMVAECYLDRSGFSVPKLLRELVDTAVVPNLPIHRYKPSGLRKREDWESTWAAQRREDVVEATVREDNAGMLEPELKTLVRQTQLKQVGDIPVPPKYASKDFKKPAFWKLRGKLDVPKERWIVYAGAERDGDPSPVIAWAGWNHLQQAQALAEYYLDAKTNQGWEVSKLQLLLAGLIDLLPWLQQWHNAVDPDLGSGLGDYFRNFVEEECRTHNLTFDQVNTARFEVMAED